MKSPGNSILDLNNVREYLRSFGINLDLIPDKIDSDGGFSDQGDSTDSPPPEIDEAIAQQSKQQHARDIIADIIAKTLLTIQQKETSYYTLLTSKTQVTKLCEAIMMQGKIATPVIAVDCEGFSRA